MRLPSDLDPPRGRIEVIPLIDIIFFLLATFIMVSLSMVKNQGIPVALPRAVTGESAAKSAAPTITITVTDAGRVYLNRELISVDEVAPRLDALKRQHDDLKLLMNADDVAYFGDVVKVLDAARRTGIGQLAIQTTGAMPADRRRPES